MKGTLRIVVALVVVLSLFGQFVAVNATPSDEVAVQDFDNNVHEADVLKLLHIIDGYTAEEDWSESKATRGEVAAMAAVLAGYDGSMNASEDLPYTDIYKGYEYAKQLKYLYNMGFLPEEALFRPDESADFDFTAKLVLYALGYKRMIDIDSNATAARSAYQQITDGVDIDRFARKDVYHMFFEALSADYLSFLSSDGKDILYKRDKTVLEDRFKAYFARGVVNATQFASLDGGYTNRGEVKIGNKVYETLLDADEYFGCEVQALVFTDDTRDRVEYLYKTREENEITFSGRDFVSITRSKISYSDENGKMRSLNLSNPVLVYNGENVSGTQYSDSLFEFTDGTITVVSNDSGGHLIKISSFDNMVIGGIDLEEKAVYSNSSDGKKVELDEEDSEKSIKIRNQDGKKIPLTELKTNTLLTFSKSLSGNVVEAFVSENTKECSFGSIKYEQGVVDKVTVDGIEYFVSDSALKKDININVKDSYLIYINCFGSIGALDTKASDSNRMGYILAIAKEGSFDTKLKIKFVEETAIDIDDAKVFYAKNKVCVDGTMYKSADKIMEAISRYNGTCEVPAVIKMNGDNLICEIDTPFYDAQNEPKNSLMPLYTTDMTKVVRHRQITYRGHFKSVFDLRFYMNLKSLTISKSLTYGDVDVINNVRDDADCKVDLFGFGKDTSIAQIAVSYDDTVAGKIPVTSKLYIVTDVVTALNEKEETAYQVSLTDGSKDYTYFVLQQYETEFEELKLGMGDFVKIGLNGKNEIGNVEVLFDFDNISASIGYISTTNKMAGDRYAIGILAQVEQATSTQILKFALDLAITNFESTYIENKPYLVEVGKKDITVKRITAAELKPYDVYGEDADVLLNSTSYMYPGQVYIIRKK